MDDLISRQVLLAEQFASLECILQANKDAGFDVYKRGWNDALQTVYDNAPSAQQWIPCSERMPEEYEEVWVTTRGSDMIACKDGETLEEAAERVWRENIRVSIGFYGSDGWYSIDGYPSMLSPVAWMPMNEPEPYKGENAND